MKRRGQLVLYAVSSAAQLGISIGCALWPLRHYLHHLNTWRRWHQAWTVSDSDLDVCLEGLAFWLAASVCCLLAVLLRHRSSQGTPSRRLKAVKWLLLAAALLGQIALMAKAMAVAVLGDEVLVPRGYRHSGLVWIYIAICGSIPAQVGLWWAAGSFITGMQREPEAAGSSRTDSSSPLLEKGLGSGSSSTDAGGKPEQGAAAPAQESKVAPKVVRALLGMSAVDTPLILVAFAAGTVAALGQALIPYFTGRIIDYASIDPNRAAFQVTTLKLIAVAFGCAVFTGIRGGLFTAAMARLNVRIRRELFGSLLTQEIGFFDTSKTGEITSRLAADTTTVSDQICLNLNVALRSATQAAIVLVFMFGASWRLTVVTFILIPLILTVCKFYGAYYRKLSKKVQTSLADANGVADEVLASMTTVKAHAAEASANKTYADRLHNFYILQIKQSVAYALYAMTNTFLPNSVAAVVLFYGGHLVLDGHMSAGALVSFMLYEQSLAGAFQMMGDMFSALTAAVGAADKVVELIQRRPEVGPTGKLQPSDFRGRLELDAVHFCYPARPNQKVLTGLTLEINPGEVVALVGPSGGGKSSVVKLIERFYLPEAGQVRLDGHDLGMYDHRWLKRRVGIVSQEPTLYGRSIKRNILYGLEAADGVPEAEHPTDADVMEAAKLANAHDFIMAMPQGYETDCGDKGVQLSGGQKQRIAIARALVRRPALLLLDEATSALDADSEAVVQEALDRVMRDHTVLVIAHRLSTVQNADRIVVINKGTVVEQGTHSQLLELGGIYSSLVRKQLQKSGSSASFSSLAQVSSESSLRGFLASRSQQS